MHSNDRIQSAIDTHGLPRYLAVEGPIGAGKTTLAKQLAETFRYDTLLEHAEDNPFLERFYQNPAGHALSTQLFFLFQRAQQLNNLQQHDAPAPAYVTDFLIDKDPLFANINLDRDELALYKQVYQQTVINPLVPDLIIYLQAPVDILLERIKQRGISSEQTIDTEYLHRVNEAYAQFFHHYSASPLLIINADAIDWVNSDESYTQLVEYLLTIKSGRHYFNPTSTLENREA